MVEKDKLLPIRLSTEADKLLRKGRRRHGDLARRIIDAIQGTDLRTVEVTERKRTPHLGSNYETTTAKLPPELHSKIKHVAAVRDTSMSALIDGCVKAYYAPKKRPQKDDE